LFFVALLLIVVTIIAALILVPIGKALAPTVTPEPTLPAINYAREISTSCEDCHLDQAALTDSGAHAGDVERLQIEAESLETIHGSLGCITCHGGTGDTQDKDAAHEGLLLDLSETHPEDCLLCHRNLPERIPEDDLRTPHGQISNAVWEGSACGVLCSDCHGAVGHGFDPLTGENICSMSVCRDCHESRGLATQLTGCAVCHTGPHQATGELSCEDCHTSTDVWQEIALQEHTVELTDKHATLDCQLCHRWPDFSGLEYGCSNCHSPSDDHEVKSDDCALCHSPDGWDVSAAVVVGQAMSAPHSVEIANDCLECHQAGETYAAPEDHAGLVNDNCQVCHAPEPVQAILHPVEGRDFCLDCHDRGEEAPMPYFSHQDYDETLCLACHVPAEAEPQAVPHTLEGRRDCLMCHGPVRIKPFPASHSNWGEELCLLCHDSDEQPTRTEHPFPLTHSGASENCILCHPGLDFATYSCETCHVQVTVEVIHIERGIKLEEDCTVCHPEGKDPMND
jgi:hypothetical protein